MIYDDLYDTPMPLNINDNDYGPETSEPVPEFLGLADMSPSLVIYKSASIFRKLLFPSQVNATQKEQMVKVLSAELEALYFGKCDADDHVQWYLSMTGRLLIFKMWLSLKYPLQAKDRPLFGNAVRDQGLRAALSILEISRKLFQDDPKSSHFRWIGKTWAQWHPLAVTLAELCIHVEGPLADRAWAAVASVWYKYEELVGDTQGSKLWKAIERLLQRALAAREKTAINREVHIGDMHGEGFASPFPDSTFDFGQMGIDEYNPSVLFGSNAPDDLQANPRYNSEPPYNTDPIPQHHLDGDYGNQIDWTEWQQFMTHYEASSFIDETTFQPWPLPPNTT